MSVQVFFLCPAIQWYSCSLNGKFLLISSCYLPHSLLHGVSSCCPLSCHSSQVPQTHFLLCGSMCSTSSCFALQLPKFHLLFLSCLILSFQQRLLFPAARLSLSFLTLHRFSKTSDSTQKILFVWVVVEGKIQEVLSR